MKLSKILFGLVSVFALAFLGACTGGDDAPEGGDGGGDAPAADGGGDADSGGGDAAPATDASN